MVMVRDSAAVVERVAIARLGPRDAPDIEELFRAAERRVAPGFLARRPPGEYTGLLCREDAVVMGARLGEKLIGYSACYRIYRRPYPEVAFLRNLDPANSVVYHGGGTVIDPAHEGRMLSRRLFLTRREELRKRGTRHFLGLIAVGNWLSLGNALHAGARLVGLAQDETALNYVAYAGDFAGHRSEPTHHVINWADTAAHARLFASGFIVVGLQPDHSDKQLSSRSRYFVFQCTDEYSDNALGK
jgi:hypothetical protein